METKNKVRRVGYWFSDEKMNKLKFLDFIEFCKQNKSLEFIQMDLERPLNGQGVYPLDAVVHKLNDLFLKADQGDEQAQVQLRHFQEYTKMYPDTIMIDPVFTARRLLNRTECFKLISESHICKTDRDVFVPAFIEINSQNHQETQRTLANNKVFYPIVSKPLLAESHEMAVIFNEQGLKDVEPPYVAQTYINHSAILYKLYMIGDQLYFVNRPSLPNYTIKDAMKDTHFFHTWDVSKQNLSVYMDKIDFDDSCKTEGQALPCDEKLRKIAVSIRKTLGMDLLGIDVIMEERTGRYGIIDVNAFPGYKGTPNFFSDLQDYILRKLKEKDESTLLKE